MLKVFVRIPAGTQYILTESFLESLHENSGRVPRLGICRFLPNLFSSIFTLKYNLTPYRLYNSSFENNQQRNLIAVFELIQ
jgi:hypothetical protein